MRGIIKRIISGILLSVMLAGIAMPLTAYAVPAPSLSSVTITDLAIDENNEINVEVTIIGTGKNLTCWYDNRQCQMNMSEGYYLVNPGSNIAYGEVVYFKTGMYYTPANYNKTVEVRFQATNVNRPWNTLSTSRSFTIPPEN